MWMKKNVFFAMHRKKGPWHKPAGIFFLRFKQQRLRFFSWPKNVQLYTSVDSTASTDGSEHLARGGVPFLSPLLVGIGKYQPLGVGLGNTQDWCIPKTIAWYNVNILEGHLSLRDLWWTFQTWIESAHQMLITKHLKSTLYVVGDGLVGLHFREILTLCAIWLECL